jgi:glutamate-1-semialdehyde 2,1-aminomutase
MTAGLTTLELIAAPHFHTRLASVTDSLVGGLQRAAAQADIPFATNQVPGMFGFFFNAARRVDTYAKVMASDVDRFRRFFHGMLDDGIYLAPSAFEAGFVSSAHTAADIDATLAAATKVFATLHAAA